MLHVGTPRAILLGVEPVWYTRSMQLLLHLRVPLSSLERLRFFSSSSCFSMFDYFPVCPPPLSHSISFSPSPLSLSPIIITSCAFQACDFTWGKRGARLPDGTPQDFNVSYNKDNFLTRMLSGYGSHPRIPLDQNDLERAKVQTRILFL